jgi:hypothetical protein
MADRTSAEIFGEVFTFVSKLEETADTKKLIKFLWKSCWNYDFSPYQMGCDEELIKLGLAKMAKSKYDGDEDEIIYKKQDGRTWDTD